MNQQTVLHLIQQSVQGDHTAFRQLVEQHQRFAYSVAFRLLCDEYETEEVVQETFIKVWKYLPEFRSGNRFTTWLYKIVVNLCYDRLKAFKVRKKYLNGAVDDAALSRLRSGEDLEKELDNSEQASIIRALSASLTPKQKVVFVLSELEEMTVEEICFITGLTPGRIKSNLYCARNEIRAKLMLIEKTEASHGI